MNAMIKNVICLVSGLAAGGGLGVLCTKKYYQKKYSDFAEKQIREMEEAYGLTDPYARPKVSVLEEFGDTEVNPDHTNTGRENGPLSSEERTEMRKKQAGEHVRTDYKSMYEGLPDLAEEEHPEEEDDFDPLPNSATQNHMDNADRPPRLISVEDAGELPSYIDHQLLFYYTYDDSIADEDGNVEENPELLLGDCLTKYGFVDDDNEEERIFVMNYELDTCYEVQKLYASLGQETGEW